MADARPIGAEPDATARADAPPERAPVSRGARLAAVALIALHAWFLLGAAAPSSNPLAPLAPQRKGPTFDEYFYVAAGVTYWRSGDFSENREHPPLAKLLTSAPLVVAGDFDVPPHWRDLLHVPQQLFYEHNGADQARNLFLARLPVVALALLLDVALFLVACGMGGAWAGLATLGLAAFDPSSIAAAATANLDFPNAALCFLALAALRRALLRGSAGSTLVAGIALGAAMLTKLTSVLLAPALGAMVVAAALEKRSARPLATLLLVALGAFSTFAAGYGFETRSLASVEGHPKFSGRSRDAAGKPHVLEKPAIRGAVEAVFGRERGVPLLTALKGLDHTLSETGRIGHKSYLLGEATPLVEGRYVGWKRFYLAVIPQKLPLTTLALVAAGVAAALVSRRRTWLDRAFLLVFPATILLQFSLGNAQVGIKYVLPALPCLFLAGGLLAPRGRAGAAVALLAILGALQATARLHPDEAMFSSVLAGGPDVGHRIAVVGDDWGQDAPGLALFARDLERISLGGHPDEEAAAIAEFLEAHEGEMAASESSGPSADLVRAMAQEIQIRGMAYRYYGEGDPSDYGYDFEALPPGPRRGLLAVHATNLHREDVNPFLGNAVDLGWLERYDPTASEGEPMPGVYRWLAKGKWVVAHRPVAKIGRAVFVYFVR